LKRKGKKRGKRVVNAETELESGRDYHPAGLGKLIVWIYESERLKGRSRKREETINTPKGEG